jgi:carboxypeptidase Taq
MAKIQTPAVSQLLEAFEKHHEKTKALDYVMNVANFDAATIAPKNDGAVNERSQAMGFWALESFNHQNNPTYDKLVADLALQSETLTPEMKRTLVLVRKRIDQLKKIDPKDYQAFAVLLSQSYTAWEKAKESNNFAAYEPYLEKILGFVRKFATLTKTVEGPLYNQLLDDYEEGMTTVKLDAFFATLKARIVPLLKKIQQSKIKIRTDFMSRKFPKHEQLAYAKNLLTYIGYDMNAGVYVMF